MEFNHFRDGQEASQVGDLRRDVVCDQLSIYARNVLGLPEQHRHLLPTPPLPVAVAQLLGYPGRLVVEGGVPLDCQM